MAEFVCKQGEEISSLEVVTIAENTYICLGTVFATNLEAEPSRGRLVFVKIDVGDETNVQLFRVLDFPLQGCVYALAVLDSHILAVALNSSVCDLLKCYILY